MNRTPLSRSRRLLGTLMLGLGLAALVACGEASPVELVDVAFEASYPKSSTTTETVLSSRSPSSGSVRHPADSVRSSASLNGSLIPVGSSITEVKTSRSALARAIRATYAGSSSLSRAFSPYPPRCRLVDGADTGTAFDGQLVTLRSGPHRLQVTAGACVSNSVDVVVP